MPTTALTILTASFSDLGVIAEGEALPAAMAQDGLTRLNNLCSTLRTQYGTVTAIQRTVFDVVADKQTYTIGLGGDFNVPRPSTVCGAGLWLNALGDAASVTSITRSGYTATVTQTAHGFAVGDEAYLAGANEIAYNGLQTVQSVPTADTYTFTVQGLPVSPATGTLTAAAVEGTPVEIPRELITDTGYQSLQLKNMSNSLFTDVYYNPTYPFGTIVLWPRPNTSANQLVLYLQNVFAGFADLTTVYDWPNVDGYAEMLQYQMDVRLAIPYGRPVSSEIAVMAVKTLGYVKRVNNKVADLPTDASILTNDRRGGYNINTSTGG